MDIFAKILYRIFLPLMPKETHAAINVEVAKVIKENRTFYNAWAIGLILFVALAAVPAIVGAITSSKLFYWVAEGGCVITFVWMIARMVPLSIKGMLSQQKQE